LSRPPAYTGCGAWDVVVEAQVIGLLDCNGGAMKAGKEYELIVAAIHRQFDDAAEVKCDESIIGVESGIQRQIDVVVRNNIAGYDVLIIVECKDYKKSVDIGRVDELIGKMRDVKAQMAVLVSDSGFTEGAIRRASGDGHIRLVSVIDTMNGKLRSRIALPVQVNLHKLEWPTTWSFLAGEGVDNDSLREVIRQRSEGFVGEFCRWCEQDENTGPLAAGDHTFERIISDDPAPRVLGRCIFAKTQRSFINPNLFAAGSAIYDHVRGEVTHGAERLSLGLDVEAIVATWKEVPLDFVLEGCRTFYAVVATYQFEGLLKDFRESMNLSHPGLLE
jgi:hypothetical protein